MLLLNGATQKLQLATGTAVSSIKVHASYVDLNGTTVTAAVANNVITTAATTDIVAAPTAGIQRNIKFLSVRNTSAASCVVTVIHNESGTAIDLISFTLLAGYTLTYNDVTGWILVDSTGARVVNTSTGRLLRTQVLTSTVASTAFSVGLDTTKIFIRGVGGGGAGGGCTSLASAASAAGGGGAGAYLEKLVAVSGGASGTYQCGAAGVGASGALGGNGGNSTLTIGGVTYTAPGGGGAPVATAVTTVSVYAGGAGGAIATNGDVNNGGEPGAPGIVQVVATPMGVGGNGGSSPLGAGGRGPITGAAGNGVAPVGGYGGGGSGALTGAAAVRTGGNGTQGVWVIDEYA